MIKSLDLALTPNIVALILFTVSTLLVFHFFEKKAKFIVISLIIINTFLNSLEMILYLNFATQLNTEVIFILFETNKNEAADFLKSYFNTKLLILVIYYLAITISCFLAKRKGFIIATLFWALLLGSSIKFSDINGSIKFRRQHVLTNILKFYTDYKNAKKDIANLKDSLEKNYSNLNAVSNKKNVTYVLIIGESFNRNHSSFYGYPRETQPLLKEEQNNSNLFVFNDVVSPHHITRKSVEKILTTLSHDNNVEYSQLFNIMDIMKKADFTTYWISNQEVVKTGSETTSAILNRANHVNFTNIYYSSYGGAFYDESLFPILDETLKDKPSNKFIIVHLRGSHIGYKGKYPPNFDKFNTDEIPEYFSKDQKLNYQTINEYDNTVIYNDFIVDSIIEKLKETNKESFVLYLPDHGESLAEKDNFFGHAEDSRRIAEVEIPFMIWTSDIYKKNNPEKIKNIQSSLNNPYNSEDTLYTILDLASTDFPQNKPEKSVINPLFKPKKRIVSSSGGDYDILKH